MLYLSTIIHQFKHKWRERLINIPKDLRIRRKVVGEGPCDVKMRFLKHCLLVWWGPFSCKWKMTPSQMAIEPPSLGFHLPPHHTAILSPPCQTEVWCLTKLRFYPLAKLPSYPITKMPTYPLVNLWSYPPPYQLTLCINDRYPPYPE